MAGRAIGRIPWSRATDYAMQVGLEPDMLGIFWSLITAIDGAYLQWMREEHEKELARQKASQKAAQARRPARSGRRGYRGRR